MKKQLSALTVRQWLPTWDRADFSAPHFRRKPPDHFLLLSLEASELRRLVGIQRRSTSKTRARTRDLGIQRAHDSSRSDEIADFVQYGFPWSALSKRQRDSGDFSDLIKPGWLPTAVVVNILLPEDERDNRSVDRADLVEVEVGQSGQALVSVPDTTEHDWQLQGLPRWK